MLVAVLVEVRLDGGAWCVCQTAMEDRLYLSEYASFSVGIHIRLEGVLWLVYGLGALPCFWNLNWRSVAQDSFEVRPLLLVFAGDCIPVGYRG